MRRRLVGETAMDPGLDGLHRIFPKFGFPSKKEI